MSKIDPLSSITTGYLSQQQIDSNFTKITNAFQNTLSRDGSSPNTVLVDLDLNNNSIINLANPVNPTDAATKEYVDSGSVTEAAASAAAALASQTAAAASQVSAASSASSASTSASTATTQATNASASAVSAAASAASINLPSIIATDTGKTILVNAAGTGYQLVASMGSSGFVLTSAGNDAIPSYAAIPSQQSSILQAFMVVGFVVSLTISTNPNTLYGFGTWTAITDQFIVGHGSTYTTTGGFANVTLASGNLPTHTLSVPTGGTVSAVGTSHLMAATDASAVTSTSFNFTGSATPFSIIPPYKAIYIWERTA